MKFNLVIVGVGGQGVILVSDIIGKSAVREGLSVRAAETHGMAQRGGSVENHLRIGRNFGPLVPRGSADVLLGLEPMEAARCLHLLSRDGIAIVNTKRVLPVSVSSGKLAYPDLDEFFEEAKRIFRKVLLLDATELAKKAGSILATNMVMLGVLTGYLPLKQETIIETIKESVPEKYLMVNLKAFELGKTVKTRSVQPSTSSRNLS